jgi:hypothetical protein
VSYGLFDQPQTAFNTLSNLAGWEVLLFFGELYQTDHFADFSQAVKHAVISSENFANQYDTEQRTIRVIAMFTRLIHAVSSSIVSGFCCS